MYIGTKKLAIPVQGEHKEPKPNEIDVYNLKLIIIAVTRLCYIAAPESFAL